MKCIECNSVSYTFEDNFALSVPMPDSSEKTLEKSFERFTRTERVPGFYCRKCNKHTTSEKRQTIWKTSLLLCLSLKKFTLNQTDKPVLSCPFDGFSLAKLSHPLAQGT